ncbi:MAG: hypothetical protein P4L53_09965 [Candidatus Obscuribacterales bacterium]|nr:hypothetical protein [Candidatus Obscuribacterales bacterium]
MAYEGNYPVDNPGQNSVECRRGGITHDQVYTDRQTGRVITRSTPECVTINGDIYLGDNPNSQRQISRIDRMDERSLDNRLSPGAREYGDNYTGSAARIAELERQNYYLQQQLSQRNQMGYEYPPQQRYYGINPMQMAGAGIGGIIGMEMMQHRGGYRHGGPGGALGFLAGSLIGGALTGGNTYPPEYMAPPRMMAWNNPEPYHYRHESPMQMYQQQRYMAMLRQRQAAIYNPGYQTYASNADYDSDYYSYN